MGNENKEVRLVPVKFGPRQTDVDVTGKKYSALPGILSTIHDTEIPEDIEIYANEQLVKDMDTEISDNVNMIELTALAGKKQV